MHGFLYSGDISETFVATFIEDKSILESIENFGNIKGKISNRHDFEIIDNSNFKLFLFGNVINFNETIKEFNIQKNNKQNLDYNVFFSHLNGSFIGILLDKNNLELRIYVDRNGLSKLYYYSEKQSIFFSTRIKKLGKILDLQVSNESLNQIFGFGFVLGDRTPFKSVKQLKRGEFLTIGDEKITKSRYHDLNLDDFNYEDESQLETELYRLWSNAIKNQVHNHDSLLIPLSGGLDSRAILAESVKHVPLEKITTLTFGALGSYDYEIGNAVSSYFGQKHYNLEVENRVGLDDLFLTFMDSEGMIDPFPNMPMLSSLRNIKNKSVISGYIGDFLVGGHNPQELVRKKIKNRTDLIWLSKYIIRNNARYSNNNSCVYEENLQENISEELHSYWPRYDDASKIYFLWFLDNHCSNWSFYKVFRFREDCVYLSPFLDNDLLDFLIKLPAKYRNKQNLYRKMLQKRYSELFTLPTKNNYGYGLGISENFLFYKKFEVALRDCLLSFIVKYINADCFKEEYLLKKPKTLQIERFNRDSNYIDYNLKIRKDKDFRRILHLLNKSLGKNIKNEDIGKLFSASITPKSPLFSNVKTIMQFYFLKNLSQSWR